MTAAEGPVDGTSPDGSSGSLLDEAILLALILERLARHITNDVAGLLASLREDLLAIVVRLDPTTLRYEANRRARLEALVEEAQDTVSDAYVAVADRVDGYLLEIADLTQDSSSSVLAGLLFIKGLSRRLDRDSLREQRDGTLVEGAAVREWWARQSGDMQFRVRRALEQAMRIEQLGQEPTLNDLVEAVRSDEPGTLFSSVGRNAEVLIFTAVHAVASSVRLETATRHPELVKYLQHISVIDQKTSTPCLSRNLRLWDLDGRPVRHSLPFRRPPLHFRCRSHVVSVLHPYPDLPPRLQRRVREENFDGKAARETDLSTWLRRRGMTRSEDPIDFDDARRELGL